MGQAEPGHCLIRRYENEFGPWLLKRLSNAAYCIDVHCKWQAIAQLFFCNDQEEQVFWVFGSISELQKAPSWEKNSEMHNSLETFLHANPAEFCFHGWGLFNHVRASDEIIIRKSLVRNLFTVIGREVAKFSTLLSDGSSPIAHRVRHTATISVELLYRKFHHTGLLVVPGTIISMWTLLNRTTVFQFLPSSEGFRRKARMELTTCS